MEINAYLVKAGSKVRTSECPCESCVMTVAWVAGSFNAAGRRTDTLVRFVGTDGSVLPQWSGAYHWLAVFVLASV